jgi:hypothetical protein
MFVNFTVLTKQITQWSTVLEQLTGPQLVNNFPAFYGTRRLITACRVAHQPSLFGPRSIHSTPYPISLKLILILFSPLRLGLPSGFFPSYFPTEPPYAPLMYHVRAKRPAHFAFFLCVCLLVYKTANVLSCIVYIQGC